MAEPESSERPLGRYQLPDAPWLLLLTAQFRERVDRRMLLAIDANVQQLTVGQRQRIKEAFMRGELVGVAGIVEDDYGNTWYQLTLGGRAISAIATGSVGLWRVDGGWRYCPDPFLDDDLVDLLDLGDAGPWGDHD